MEGYIKEKITIYVFYEKYLQITIILFANKVKF